MRPKSSLDLPPSSLNWSAWGPAWEEWRLKEERKTECARNEESARGEGSTDLPKRVFARVLELYQGKTWLKC